MIISGLSPETIMEICGRSLSFWVYQVFQENNYQDLLIKASEEKKLLAEKQLSLCIGQAKSELHGRAIIMIQPK
jgi:E3 ubiquitin-protein ligase CCNP1IP1